MLTFCEPMTITRITTQIFSSVTTEVTMALVSAPRATTAVTPKSIRGAPRDTENQGSDSKGWQPEKQSLSSRFAVPKSHSIQLFQLFSLYKLIYIILLS